MTIPPGTRMGRYEIRSRLGAGGMGEVYLAQDTSELGRLVALKILSADVAKDKDRLQRFTQEARTVSNLNHPNILTVHEFGQTNSTSFIVTEYVDGVTLRQYLSSRKSKLIDMLDVAIQMVAALNAAHEAGVIHRDLKPENVMVRKDHIVKVLDFGLAKLSEKRPMEGEARGNEEELNTLIAASPGYPMAVSPLTEPGLVMGTVSYMSPEQSIGKGVDQRSDIWSAGVVLYEMITGVVPFGGKDIHRQIIAIQESDPVPLTQQVEGVPERLEEIVNKCLAKDNDERYQTAKDLLIDLRNLRRKLDVDSEIERMVAPSMRSASAGGPGITRAPRKSGDATVTIANADTVSSAEYVVTGIKQHRVAAIIILLVLVGALAGLGYLFFRPKQSAKSLKAFRSPRIAQITTGENTIHAAISPDGKYLAHVESSIGQQTLWVKQVNANNDVQIVPPMKGGYYGVTFSPDGTDLYYVFDPYGTRVLYRVPILGGTPTQLLSNIDSPVTFSPDGKQMAFVRGDYSTKGESSLVIVNSDGTGERTLVVKKSPEAFTPLYFTGPSWSPDGKVIASSLQNYQGGEHVDLMVFRVSDGMGQKLNRERWPYIGRVQWMPDSSGLLMIAGDLGRRVVQVHCVSYPDGVTRNVTSDLDGYRDLSLTADGSKLITVQMSARFTMWSLPVDDYLKATQILSIKTSNSAISWTPDGKILFTGSTADRPDIWVVNADGTARKQLTANAGNNYDLAVSHDGRYLVFSSNRTGNYNIWRTDIDGSNPVRLTSGLSEGVPNTSPDGRWVVYESFDPGKPGIWKVPIDGGEPVLITGKGLSSAPVSPDGKMIACLYVSDPNQNGPARLAIIPFEGGEPVKTFEIQNSISTSVLPSIHWALDGRSVLYVSSLNNVSNIWSQPIDGSKPKQVTDFKDSLIVSFDISSDGKQMICSRGVLIRNAVLISEGE